MEDPLASCISVWPSARMPLPASKTTHSSSVVRISRQDVLPPNFRFSIWGVGVEPRTPQNLSRTRTPFIKRPFWHEFASCHPFEFVILAHWHTLRGPGRRDSTIFPHPRSVPGSRHSAHPVSQRLAIG